MPSSHREVLGAGTRGMRKDGKWIGLPLVPTDAMCLILTFTDPPADGEEFVERAAVERAVGELRELAELAHPAVAELEPDPLLRPHGRRGRRRLRALRLRLCELCGPAPTRGASPSPTFRRPGAAGALLGGAGIGVSARSANRDAAIAYARHLVLTADTSAASYVGAGGQPGSLPAWQRRRGQRGDRQFLRRHAGDDPGLLSQADPCGLPGLLPRLRTARRGRHCRRVVGRRAVVLPRPSLPRVAGQRAGRPPEASPDGGDRRSRCESEEQGRGEYRAPAAEKALDILEFMADQAIGLTQTEISAGLGRSIHEIYRILHLLETPRLSGAHQGRSLPAVAEAVRARAHAPAGQPAGRERAAGDARARRRHRPELPSRRAQRPARAGRAADRFALADALFRGARLAISRSSRRAPAPCCSPPPSPPTANASSASILAAGEAGDTRQAIEARLDEARALGHEMHASLAVAGCTNLSLPVRDHTGRAVAALTVPFLPQKAARFDQETVFSRAAACRRKDFRRARRRRARHVRLIVTTRDGGTNRPELNPKVIGRVCMTGHRTIPSRHRRHGDGRCAGAWRRTCRRRSATSSTTPRTNGTRTSSRA